MASTVKAEMDKANPNNSNDLNRLAKLGSGLSLSPRTEQLVVAANLTTPSVPPKQILSCFIVAAGASNGWAAVAASETTPGAGEIAIDHLGRFEFAAADAVTLVEVTYVPLEGELVTEDIPVTAGGLGTFTDEKSCAQIVSATLNAPGATPGAKTVVARGTLVGALGAGECAVQFDGTQLQFVAAEAGVACTATVSYYAFPGVGVATEPFGDRLDADFTP